MSEAAKVNQVLTWILEGNSEHLIHEAIQETWPGEKSAPLIIKAVRGVQLSARTMKKNANEWAIAATKFLYQKQVEIGEYAGAMRAVKQISELTTKPKPAPPAASPVTVNVGVQLDPDERRMRLLEIAERIRSSRLVVESSARRSE